MKKMMMTMVGATLLMSSCGTYTGTGAVVGAQLGTILGSAVGGISGGWRGSDIGAITGMAGGAMVGAAIGAAADQKAEQQAMEREEAYRRRHMEREMPQYPPQGYGTQGTQGQAGDDRVDFGIAGPQGSLTPNPSPKGEGSRNSPQPSPKERGYGASTNKEGNWSLTPMGPGNQREGNFKITSLVELRNVHLMEADGDGVLRRGKQMKLVFELMNRADRTLYNVCPMVTDLTHNKHVFISPNMAIESIATGTGVRYTATIQADNRLKDGELVIHIGVMVESRELASVAQEIVIRTAKK